jgi:DNA-binding MarR family transcriptional regulator
MYTSAMAEPMDPGQELALALAAANAAVERRLDRHLGGIRGISLGEYRLLRALANAAQGRASRVELAAMVGLTPSGATRALRPLEKFGYVVTVKNERDARLALATLTAAGEELVDDASRVVDDAMASILERKPSLVDHHAEFLAMLGELARP